MVDCGWGMEDVRMEIVDVGWLILDVSYRIWVV